MLIATARAVYRLGDANGSKPQRVFQGEGVRRVAVRGGMGLVVLEGGDLVFLGRPQGTVPTGITDPIAAVAILDAEPIELLFGTDEGAHLYRLVGTEGPAERVDSFDTLDARARWRTPWGGPPAVRVLATTDDGWVYADIHVGSIMYSSNRGRTWAPVTPDLDDDVHDIATTPADPNRLVANTANAIYVSDDRGRTWYHRASGLPNRYGRAIAVHPVDPDLFLATVSDGPHGGNGTLHRSEDGGRTWEPIRDGFPAPVDHNIDTNRVAFSSDGTAWVADGTILYVGTERAAR